MYWRSEGLALTSDEAARIVGLYVEQDAFFQVVLLDGGGEAEEFQDSLQCGFRFSRHGAVVDS